MRVIGYFSLHNKYGVLILIDFIICDQKDNLYCKLNKHMNYL